MTWINRFPVAIATLLALAAGSVQGQDPAAAKAYAALMEAYEEEGGARAFAKRFIQFAERHPDDSTAADALLWAIKRVRGQADTDKALKLLAASHSKRKSLAEGCKIIERARSLESEKLLRKLLKDNPHREVRASAGYHLAALLDSEALVVEQLESDPEAGKRLLQYYGRDYGKHLASLKSDDLDQAREAVYAAMLESYADLEVDDEKLGELAKKNLFLLQRLTAGKAAPEIEGRDIRGKAMKLSDFRGKVVMLSFWGHW